MNTRQILIVVCTGALFLVGLLFWWFNGHQTNDLGVAEEKRGVVGTPIDVTLDFYESWLDARQSSTSDPYTQNLDKATVLSSAMSTRLMNSKNALQAGEQDPVLCQSVVPSGLNARLIFEKDNAAQILILSKGGQLDTQTVVTLAKHETLWEITDITCRVGEQGPAQGEFTFDKEGHLLKMSVKPPLDPQYWHLVFEQSGVLGYTAPLFFSDSSICVLQGGKEEACRDDMFTEALHVRVQGAMTEAGVEVKRIEVLE